MVSHQWNLFSTLLPLFFIFWISNFGCSPSQRISASRFLSPRSWRIYEIVQKYNFHLRGLFATHGIGRIEVVCTNGGFGNGIPLEAEDNICCGGRGGVFVKKRGLPEIVSTDHEFHVSSKSQREIHLLVSFFHDKYNAMFDDQHLNISLFSR